jgi:DNA-binding NarL/FixJ family response regulator
MVFKAVMNGSIATGLIKEICPYTGIIIMSRLFDDDTIVEALRSGAGACIYKGDSGRNGTIVVKGEKRR